jgi:hypothetical protein
MVAQVTTGNVEDCIVLTQAGMGYHVETIGHALFSLVYGRWGLFLWKPLDSSILICRKS